MTATRIPRDTSGAGDIALIHRIPEPTSIVTAQVVRMLAESGRDEVGQVTMWTLLQEAGIHCDGYTACITLERLGLLTRSTESEHLWVIHPALRDATLAAKVSAKLWLDAVIEYIQAPFREREKLLELD